jgi:hypothetical protein
MKLCRECKGVSLKHDECSRCHGFGIDVERPRADRAPLGDENKWTFVWSQIGDFSGQDPNYRLRSVSFPADEHARTRELIAKRLLGLGRAEAAAFIGRLLWEEGVYEEIETRANAS